MGDIFNGGSTVVMIFSSVCLSICLCVSWSSLQPQPHKSQWICICWWHWPLHKKLHNTHANVTEYVMVFSPASLIPLLSCSHCFIATSQMTCHPSNAFMHVRARTVCIFYSVMVNTSPFLTRYTLQIPLEMNRWYLVGFFSLMYSDW